MFVPDKKVSEVKMLLAGDVMQGACTESSEIAGEMIHVRAHWQCICELPCLQHSQMPEPKGTTHVRQK